MMILTIKVWLENETWIWKIGQFLHQSLPKSKEDDMMKDLKSQLEDYPLSRHFFQIF